MILICVPIDEYTSFKRQLLISSMENMKGATAYYYYYYYYY